MSPPDIRTILRNEVERCSAEAKLSTDHFNTVLKDIPSGLPHPDGAQRIRNASIHNAATHTRLRLAMKREMDFILHGTIPEDLIDPRES